MAPKKNPHGQITEPGFKGVFRFNDTGLVGLEFGLDPFQMEE